ncbi:MAG: hypothetical protein J0L97_05075 [Alphaproteobacteria bacterium]|nr:hypothetical protein [Alphaproteobacteria bacterium]
MKLHPKYERYFWSGAVVGILSLLIPLSSLLAMGVDSPRHWGTFAIMGGGILMIGPVMMVDALQKSREAFKLETPESLPESAKRTTPRLR